MTVFRVIMFVYGVFESWVIHSCLISNTSNSNDILTSKSIDGESKRSPRIGNSPRSDDTYIYLYIQDVFHEHGMFYCIEFTTPSPPPENSAFFLKIGSFQARLGEAFDLFVIISMWKDN